MAIFTTVSELDAHTLLKQYQLGELSSLKGISKGIDNTNYFLTTNTGEYVLTIFERLTFAQLPFYIELMHHLASQAVLVPHPQTMNNGQRITTLHDKPCGIVTKLRGTWEAQPNSTHCYLVGQALAQLHLTAQDFPMHQDNLMGMAWWQETIPQVTPFLEPRLQQLLLNEFEFQTEFMTSDDYRNLPKGAIHGDLFRDNVMFSGTQEAPILEGFLDFYFAATDTWLYDVAVCANDWCINLQTGEFDSPRLAALIEGYQNIREFETIEIKAWNSTLRSASLRFWLSRLYDLHLPRPAQVLIPHDPTHFERILLLRRQGSPALNDF